MANFTINSLSAGTINPTDNFLKSDASGALTRVSEQALKADMIGVDDFSAVGNSVSNAILNGVFNRRHVSVAPVGLNGNIAVDRVGYMCFASIFGALVTAQLSNGDAVLTLPDGYKPTATQIDSIGTAYKSDGTSYPVTIRAVSGKLYILSNRNSNKVDQNNILYVSASWPTWDAMPAAT